MNEEESFTFERFMRNSEGNFQFDWEGKVYCVGISPSTGKRTVFYLSKEDLTVNGIWSDEEYNLNYDAFLSQPPSTSVQETTSTNTVAEMVNNEEQTTSTKTVAEIANNVEETTSTKTVAEIASNVEETTSTKTTANNDDTAILINNADKNWTVGETKLLLDKYAEYMSQVGPMKKFRNLKQMWEKIATEVSAIGSTKSGSQCDTRYKTLKKRKTAAKKNNNTSGTSRMSVDYEEEFGKIKSLDDSFEPEVMRGVGKVSFKSTISHDLNSSSEAPSDNPVQGQVASESNKTSSPSGTTSSEAAAENPSGTEKRPSPTSDTSSSKVKSKIRRKSSTTSSVMSYLEKQQKDKENEKEEKAIEKKEREEAKDRRHKDRLNLYERVETAKNETLASILGLMKAKYESNY